MPGGVSKTTWGSRFPTTTRRSSTPTPRSSCTSTSTSITRRRNAGTFGAGSARPSRRGPRWSGTTRSTEIHGRFWARTNCGSEHRTGSPPPRLGPGRNRLPRTGQRGQAAHLRGERRRGVLLPGHPVLRMATPVREWGGRRRPRQRHPLSGPGQVQEPARDTAGPHDLGGPATPPGEPADREARQTTKDERGSDPA